jgi:hypothetical protein
LGESFLEKMEIGESFFGKNHGKLAHLQNLAPKIIYAIGDHCLSLLYYAPLAYLIQHPHTLLVLANAPCRIFESGEILTSRPSHHLVPPMSLYDDGNNHSGIFPGDSFLDSGEHLLVFYHN